MALASPCGAAGVTITRAAREAHQRAGTLAAQNIRWLKKKKKSCNKKENCLSLKTKKKQLAPAVGMFYEAIAR